MGQLRHLKEHFVDTRRQTEALTSGLALEDYGVQSMPDASPVKWHLAHTTWFFETFVLAENLPGFRPRDPAYAYLFNSYYETVGPQWSRPQRGILSRPTVKEVKAWRADVETQVTDALDRGQLDDAAQALVLLGIHHEQQHQELLVVDLKHALGQNPIDISIVPPSAFVGAPHPGFKSYDGGLVEVGHAGTGFAFDNEGPRHTTYLAPFRLARSTITCGEYLEFMQDGGYTRPELWLSDAWYLLKELQWDCPLHWYQVDEAWVEYTLGGRRALVLDAPLCHVSFYEADAYARWRGKRLPTEHEWEHAASLESALDVAATLESGALHPTGSSGPHGGLQSMFGDVWEWTGSPYRPYPGFRAPTGAVGEYNGKFMNGQYILKGGSCATPRSHIRTTYRNFFGPDKRWNFSGIRLADDES
jgi:ergothioneine biosynthesis protein EgtB